MSKFLDFFNETLQDPRGIPDTKLITISAFAITIICSIPYGLHTGKWIPEYMFSSIMILIGAGLGLSSFEIKEAIKAKVLLGINPDKTEVKTDTVDTTQPDGK